MRRAARAALRCIHEVAIELVSKTHPDTWVKDLPLTCNLQLAVLAASWRTSSPCRATSSVHLHVTTFTSSSPPPPPPPQLLRMRCCCVCGFLQPIITRHFRTEPPSTHVVDFLQELYFGSNKGGHWGWPPWHAPPPTPFQAWFQLPRIWNSKNIYIPGYPFQNLSESHAPSVQRRAYLLISLQPARQGCPSQNHVDGMRGQAI